MVRAGLTVQEAVRMWTAGVRGGREVALLSWLLTEQL
jgi:hypothetical protein